MGVNHSIFGTFCSICFSGLTFEQCAEDVSGDKWDVCKGKCAREAGIEERLNGGQGPDAGVSPRSL